MRTQRKAELAHRMFTMTLTIKILNIIWDRVGASLLAASAVGMNNMLIVEKHRNVSSATNSTLIFMPTAASPLTASLENPISIIVRARLHIRTLVHVAHVRETHVCWTTILGHTDWLESKTVELEKGNLVDMAFKTEEIPHLTAFYEAQGRSSRGNWFEILIYAKDMQYSVGDGQVSHYGSNPHSALMS